MRGGAVAARRAHNPKVAGSSPAPAIFMNHSLTGYGFHLTRRSVVEKNPRTGGFCMNRRSSNSLPLAKAITGFTNYKTAEGLSQTSIDSYERILGQWEEYSGNKHVAQFTDQDINSYPVYMRLDRSRANGAATRAICPRKYSEYLDHDVFLLSLGKFRIPHRKPDEECPSNAL